MNSITRWLINDVGEAVCEPIEDYTVMEARAYQRFSLINYRRRMKVINDRAKSALSLLQKNEKQCSSWETEAFRKLEEVVEVSNVK